MSQLVSLDNFSKHLLQLEAARQEKVRTENFQALASRLNNLDIRVTRSQVNLEEDDTGRVISTPEWHIELIGSYRKNLIFRRKCRGCGSSLGKLEFDATAEALLMRNDLTKLVRNSQAVYESGRCPNCPPPAPPPEPDPDPLPARVYDLEE